jgi:hypothetical protein
MTNACVWVGPSFCSPHPPPTSRVIEGFQFRIGAQLYTEDQYDNVVGK